MVSLNKIARISPAVEGDSSEENIPKDAFKIAPSQGDGQRPLTTEPRREWESVSELCQPGKDSLHKIIRQQPLDGEGTTRLEAISEETDEEECVSPETSWPEPQAPEQNKEGERRSERSQKQPKRYGNPITFSPLHATLDAEMWDHALRCVSSRKICNRWRSLPKSWGSQVWRFGMVVVTEVSFRQFEAPLDHLRQWLSEKLTQPKDGLLPEDLKIVADDSGPTDVHRIIL
ncbi:hypothetical protein OUZ56_011955 [Daphnia magna]|uniref:Uncharacterized protein n=1 Tax=Daphnia magna TaxID=35525 RepID=A0ABQ9Z1M1_9CRUS|nr:hypothetical protein OUZ56_011955 [Daphnia magna]